MFDSRVPFFNGSRIPEIRGGPKAFDLGLLVVRAGHRRTGRPKLKWYHMVRAAVTDRLTTLEILPANWTNTINEIEMLQIN